MNTRTRTRVFVPTRNQTQRPINISTLQKKITNQRNTINDLTKQLQNCKIGKVFTPRPRKTKKKKKSSNPSEPQTFAESTMNVVKKPLQMLGVVGTTIIIALMIQPTLADSGFKKAVGGDTILCREQACEECIRNGTDKLCSVMSPSMRVDQKVLAGKRYYVDHKTILRLKEGDYVEENCRGIDQYRCGLLDDKDQLKFFSRLYLGSPYARRVPGIRIKRQTEPNAGGTIQTVHSPLSKNVRNFQFTTESITVLVLSCVVAYFIYQEFGMVYAVLILIIGFFAIIAVAETRHQAVCDRLVNTGILNADGKSTDTIVLRSGSCVKGLIAKDPVIFGLEDMHFVGDFEYIETVPTEYRSSLICKDSCPQVTPDCPVCSNPGMCHRDFVDRGWGNGCFLFAKGTTCCALDLNSVIEQEYDVWRSRSSEFLMHVTIDYRGKALKVLANNQPKVFNHPTLGEIQVQCHKLDSEYQWNTYFAVGENKDTGNADLLTCQMPGSLSSALDAPYKKGKSAVLEEPQRAVVWRDCDKTTCTYNAHTDFTSKLTSYFSKLPCHKSQVVVEPDGLQRPHNITIGGETLCQVVFKGATQLPATPPTCTTFKVSYLGTLMLDGLHYIKVMITSQVECEQMIKPPDTCSFSTTYLKANNETLVRYECYRTATWHLGDAQLELTGVGFFESIIHQGDAYWDKYVVPSKFVGGSGISNVVVGVFQGIIGTVSTTLQQVLGISGPMVHLITAILFGMLVTILASIYVGNAIGTVIGVGTFVLVLSVRPVTAQSEADYGCYSLSDVQLQSLGYQQVNFSSCLQAACEIAKATNPPQYLAVVNSSTVCGVIKFLNSSYEKYLVDTSFCTKPNYFSIRRLSRIQSCLLDETSDCKTGRPVTYNNGYGDIHECRCPVFSRPFSCEDPLTKDCTTTCSPGQRCVLNVTNAELEYERQYPSSKPLVPPGAICPTTISITSPWNDTLLVPSECTFSLIKQGSPAAHDCIYPPRCFNAEFGKHSMDGSCHRLFDGTVYMYDCTEPGVATDHKDTCPSIGAGCVDRDDPQDGACTYPTQYGTNFIGTDSTVLTIYLPDHYYITSLAIYNRYDCCRIRFVDVSVKAANFDNLTLAQSLSMVDHFTGKEGLTINSQNICYAFYHFTPVGVGIKTNVISLSLPLYAFNLAEIIPFGYTGTARQLVKSPFLYRSLITGQCVDDKCFQCRGSCEDNVCVCPLGWFGENCDQECVLLPDGTCVPCINGDFKDGVCQCHTPFTGQDCNTLTTTEITYDGPICDYRWPLCEVMCYSCPSDDHYPVNHHNLHDCHNTWPFNYFCKNTEYSDNCQYTFPFSISCWYRNNHNDDPRDKPEVGHYSSVG